MTRKYFKASMAALAALLAIACSEKTLDYKDLGFSRADYSGVPEGEALTLTADMAQSDFFETTVLKVSGLASECVLYAYKADGTKLFGPEDYSSESGFYFDSKGYACSPADDDAHFFVDAAPAAGQISVGQVPEACKPGEEYTLHLGMASQKALTPIEIKITVSEVQAWCGYIAHEDGLTFDIYEQVKMDYTPCKVPVDVQALCKALGVSSESAIVSGIANNSIKFVGLNSDGSEYASGNTANGSGHWFNTSGDVCSWKSEGWFMYAEWTSNAAPIVFSIGQAITGIEVGQKATLRQKFVKGSNEAVLTWNVNIVEKVPGDATIPED